MVRYFIYFHFYMVTTGDSTTVFNLGSMITVQKDSLSFYIYDVGYLKWKIDHTLKEDIQEFNPYLKFVTAVYFVSFEDLRAIVHIDSPDAEIRILTRNIPFVIRLKY